MWLPAATPRRPAQLETQHEHEPIVSVSELSPVASILDSVFQGLHVTAVPASLSFLY
jgi:hypothetical protein